MGPPPPHALSMRTLAAYASRIPGKNDGEEFAKLQVALGWFGLEPRVQEGLWEVLLGLEKKTKKKMKKSGAKKQAAKGKAAKSGSASGTSGAPARPKAKGKKKPT